MRFENILLEGTINITSLATLYSWREYWHVLQSIALGTRGITQTSRVISYLRHKINNYK